MGYQTNIEGFEGQKIEVSVSFVTGPKLMVNGARAQKGSKRGEMLLQRNDGRQVTATWRPQLFGLDVPQLNVDGKTIRLVEPLKWYQWVWSGLPVILVALGGALGALAGMIGFLLNARIFRTEMNEVLKFVVTGVVSVLAFIGYFVTAIVFTLLLNG